MKKAYQYVRISQAEQSNWSIEGQKDLNQRYAERHGIEIVRTFIDDGRSAKDFDRPGWKELERDLSKNRHKVDYLIIPKYDRLIRNTLQGLQHLEKIENTWNVQVLSAMESYAIDPGDPMFFKMRADLLVNAEFERRVISDRSKFGTWQAKRQGRHIGHAPFGYENARDDTNRPIIILDVDKAEIVREIFSRYLNNDEIGVIRTAARDNGFTVKGKSSIRRVLENPIYAGLIRVPSYKGDPEKIIEGQHEAIIDKHTWYQVQERLRLTDKHVKVTLREEVPLRGLILCQVCGNPLTGGRSRGKMGVHYFYYRCTCKGENFSAVKSHDQLQEVLNLLSIDRASVDKIHNIIYEIYKQKTSGMKEKVGRVKQEVSHLHNKLDSLEEKFIRDAITSETYQKWTDRISRDLAGKETELVRMQSMDESKLFECRHLLEQMGSLGFLFQRLPILKKQDMFRFVFPGSVIKSHKGYRTQIVNPILEHNLHKFKGLDLLEIPDLGAIFSQNPISTRSGSIIELLGVYKKIIKTA